MFTINQILEAHSKVKSGADFPRYVRDLIDLGIAKYVTYVDDGHSEYSGKDNFTTKSEGKYSLMTVAEESDKKKFVSYLKIHQEGQTDYMTFCKHSAQTGVEKWNVDLEELTCTYYDKAGNEMLVEAIVTPA